MAEEAVSGSAKRVQRSKDLILAETYKMLTESGIGGVSIDKVSLRSGVSKTTIYRHWDSRAALLLEACSKIGTRPEIPDTGKVETDLFILVDNLTKQLKSEKWPAVLPSIIDAAEREPEIADMHSNLHAGLMTPYFAVIEKAQKRGQLSKKHSASEIVSSIVGPFFYRRWFSRESITEEFAHGVARRVAEQYR